MNRIVTISFTPLDAPGGVPKFNRELHEAFPDRERVHFSWWDYPWAIEMENVPEWEKARILNHALIQGKKLRPDDVVIADGFWADGLQHMKNVVSHSHGIWSHLTKDDVDAGKQPENPYHHAAQVAFRQRWTSLGKHITAVSDFIAEQMRLQWGFKVDRVINNGVDVNLWRPREKSEVIRRPLIIHGVNDRGNINKGWDHIVKIKEVLPDAVVLSLDEAFEAYKDTGHDWVKQYLLAQADVVVHPSGYEGNSMFVAEALSCGVPVVGYDVGYLWKASKELGTAIDRTQRSPEFTCSAVIECLGNPGLLKYNAEKGRELALRDLSIEVFRSSWRDYVEQIDAA